VAASLIEIRLAAELFLSNFTKREVSNIVEHKMVRKFSQQSIKLACSKSQTLVRSLLKKVKISYFLLFFNFLKRQLLDQLRDHPCNILTFVVGTGETIY
jgi:superfamily II helicase